MPWKETCPMYEKLAFVSECLRGELPMVALCEDYGISRKTGYKWLGRYRERGAAGLVERTRAPRCHGRSMAPEVAEAIVALRRARPHWGPRKLRAVLMGEQPGKVWPAASTMGDLLRAEGLVSARRRRRRIAAPSRTLRPANGPNDVWCIDFKGWFRTRDGERCDPLTVTDAYSRFLLACVILPPRTEEVRAAVKQLFERYGLPGDDPFGQRVALCRHGRGRSVPVVGRLAQGRHCAGADRPGPAPAERAARAHAQDLGDRDDQAAGCEHGAPTGPLRPLPQGLQRQPAPRGARPAAACVVLPALAADLGPSGFRSLGTMPGTPCAGCARTGRSSGAATWCSSARRWRASRSASPRPTAATGSFASPTSTSGSSIAGRKDFMASGRPGRAARKHNEPRTLLPM